MVLRCLFLLCSALSDVAPKTSLSLQLWAGFWWSSESLLCKIQACTNSALIYCCCCCCCCYLLSGVRLFASLWTATCQAPNNAVHKILAVLHMYVWLSAFAIYLNCSQHCWWAMVRAESLSPVRLSATPSSIAHQASLSWGILQAGILERVAISSSRGSSWPKGQTHASWVSCIGRQTLYLFTSHWGGQKDVSFSVFLIPQYKIRGFKKIIKKTKYWPS